MNLYQKQSENNSSSYKKLSTRKPLLHYLDRSTEIQGAMLPKTDRQYKVDY
jgi:hypothetical protein